MPKTVKIVVEIASMFTTESASATDTDSRAMSYKRFQRKGSQRNNLAAKACKISLVRSFSYHLYWAHYIGHTTSSYLFVPRSILILPVARLRESMHSCLTKHQCARKKRTGRPSSSSERGRALMQRGCSPFPMRSRRKEQLVPARAAGRLR